jgi:hypothetical protein
LRFQRCNSLISISIRKLSRSMTSLVSHHYCSIKHNPISINKLWESSFFSVKFKPIFLIVFVNLSNLFLILRVIYTKVFFLTIVFELWCILMLINISSFSNKSKVSFKDLRRLNTITISLFWKAYDPQIFMMSSFGSHKF